MARSLEDQSGARLVGGLLLLLGSLALTEAVLEPPGHVLEVPHAASSCGPPAVGLCAPVVLAHPGRRVGARGTPGLLHVVGTLTAPTADNVRLGVALTKRRGTLSLHTQPSTSVSSSK